MATATASTASPQIMKKKSMGASAISPSSAVAPFFGRAVAPIRLLPSTIVPSGGGGAAGDDAAHHFLVVSPASMPATTTTAPGKQPPPAPQVLRHVEFRENTSGGSVGTLKEISSQPLPFDTLAVSVSPSDSSLFFTLHSGDKGARLWRMHYPGYLTTLPGASNTTSSSSSFVALGSTKKKSSNSTPANTNSGASSSLVAASATPPANYDKEVMVPVCDLPIGNLDHASQLGAFRALKWQPVPNSRIVLSLHEYGINLWNVNASEAAAISNLSDDDIEYESFRACAWDPHDPNNLVATKGTSICMYDIRKSLEIPIHTIPNAHSPSIKDIDFNPRRPNILASSGDDGLVKFWDFRHDHIPIKILSGHNHWVTQVKYNPFNDQFILSASTDRQAVLWQVPSISSTSMEAQEEAAQKAGPKPTDNLQKGKSGKKLLSIDVTELPEDMLYKKYDEHEDVINECAWSALNSRVFSTISRNGKVYFHQVPKAPVPY